MNLGEAKSVALEDSRTSAALSSGVDEELGSGDSAGAEEWRSRVFKAGSGRKLAGSKPAD